MPYKGDKGDKNAARPPEGSLVETRCLIKGPKSAIVPFPGPRSGPKSRSGPGAFAAKSVRGDLCIYRCVPPTHEYGTRPFLRWARSQGRSPHASGKAKNTFGPVGIPFFGAPQAPGNKPNPPEGGISLGDGPWGRRNSPVPRHTRQNRPEIKRPTECNPRTGEEKRSAGTSKFFRRRSVVDMKGRQHYFCRAM